MLSESELFMVLKYQFACDSHSVGIRDFCTCTTDVDSKKYEIGQFEKFLIWLCISKSYIACQLYMSNHRH